MRTGGGDRERKGGERGAVGVREGGKRGGGRRRWSGEGTGEGGKAEDEERGAKGTRGRGPEARLSTGSHHPSAGQIPKNCLAMKKTKPKHP